MTTPTPATSRSYGRGTRLDQVNPDDRTGAYATFTADMSLVLEAADEWAGEYGFAPSMREQAGNVQDAVERLRAQYLPDTQEQP